MAIPKIKKQNVIDALKYIDEHGVPSQNQSTKYELITEDGKKYPPKYVIAVAAHLENGVDITTDGFNAYNGPHVKTSNEDLMVNSRS